MAGWAERLVLVLMKHWLPLVLVPLWLFTLLPFAAPIAMHADWTRLGRLIYTLYSPLCHQLPQRSWFLFGEQFTYSLSQIARVADSESVWQLRTFYGTSEMGWKVAWSDRMISFYGGFPLFGLLYAALRRWRPVIPIPLWALALSLLPLVLDGGTHLISDMVWGISGGGLRDTNAWLAILTDNAWPGFYVGDTFGSFNWWMRLVTGLLAAWGLAFYAFSWMDRLMQEELVRYQTRVG